MLVLSPRLFRGLFILLCVVAPPMAAAAHEFWIDPVQFRLEASEEITANLRIGQEFKGDAYPFLPARSKGTWTVDADGMRPWRAQIGDMPAVNEAPGPSGLHVLSYYSTPSRLTYSEPGKFAKFLDESGLNWALEEHRQRGFEEVGFDEAFTRCAKALVQSGEGDGEDVIIGMPIELVANANPYELTLTDAVMPVMLLWQGEPLADAQITVFRLKDELDITEVQTGPDGGALIPLAGGGKFLLNAVHIIPWDEQPDDVWHSYWASLTFEISTAP